MTEEERQIKNTYQYQIVLLRNFVWQLIHHRAMKAAIHEFNQGFWRMTFSNCLDMAVLEWCKLFGANAEHQHWSKVFSNKDEFRQHILKATGMNSGQWKKYWEELTAYRNEAVSHFFPDFKPPRYPDMEPALKSVFACYEYLLEKLDKYGVQHGFPYSLEIYANNLFKQALLYSKKAYGGTAQLEERFK
jgi:hypothetical protein